MNKFVAIYISFIVSALNGMENTNIVPIADLMGEIRSHLIRTKELPSAVKLLGMLRMVNDFQLNEEFLQTTIDKRRIEFGDEPLGTLLELHKLFGNKVFDSIQNLKNNEYNSEIQSALASRDGTTIKKALGMALISATTDNNYVQICFLIKSGADVNFCDELGNSALKYATLSRNLELVNHLLNNGANPNIMNSIYETCLMQAAINNDEAITQALILHGAQVNAVDLHGETALLKVVKAAGKVSFVKLLVMAGADSSKADKQGNTPLLIAQRKIKFNNDTSLMKERFAEIILYLQGFILNFEI